MAWCNQCCAIRISFRPYPVCYLYLHTFIDFVKYSDLFLFADHNKLFKIIKTEQDSSLLQYDIDFMCNWTLNSLLLFHPKKYFTIHVDSKSDSSINEATYKMNDNILWNKLELKGVGVVVDNHLTFGKHIAENINKPNQIMGLIRYKFCIFKQKQL